VRNPQSLDGVIPAKARIALCVTPQSLDGVIPAKAGIALKLPSDAPPPDVIPAKAGIAFQQRSWSSILTCSKRQVSKPEWPNEGTNRHGPVNFRGVQKWISAFAGMTSWMGSRVEQRAIPA
jgi:hypothetical protein